jgi:hypothetical protein
MLFEDFVLVFFIVFHPFQNQIGYDDNRFTDKPCFPMISLVWHKSLLILLLKAPFLLLFNLMSLVLVQIIH